MSKQVIKNLFPRPMWSRLQRAKARYRLTRLSKTQDSQFIKYSANPWNKPNQEELRGQIIYYIHRIEKGLTHVSDFRAGFGRNALQNLHDLMTDWRHAHYPTDDTTYRAALSVVMAYIDKHRQENKELPPFLFTLFPVDELEEKQADNTISGVRTITAEEKRTNKQKNFKELFENRTSVRQYADTPVDLNAIRRAIELSMKTPSVCNRQSYRVTVVTNKQLITRILKIQGGWRGYAAPPALAIITSDVRSFIYMEEHNEPYVDGGIFTMAFLLSLEYENLAACPLNLMCSDESAAKIRHLSQIPDYEVLIDCVAIGNFPEKVLAPKSFRYPGESITRIVQ